MTVEETPAAGHRFYGDLAEWWPLISPPDEYKEEAAYLGKLLDSGATPVTEVLELGSGGGHVAFHLKSSFAMTLVELSPQMLEMSRRINPECDHLQGNMRTLRLQETFDAVLIHDAVAYMTTESELRQAIETAFVHCRPEGVAVFVPDDTTETFEPRTDHGGTDGAEGRAVRYLEWSWDPNSNDTSALTEYAFLLRAPDGGVDAVHETHRLGLFSRDVWLRIINDTGFIASAVTEETTEDRTPREIFIGYRPATSPGVRGSWCFTHFELGSNKGSLRSGIDMPRLGRWLVAGLGLLVALQFVPYGRGHDNPPVVAEPPWDSPTTRQLAVRACFDCHSNETRWPWYSSIAPLSWFIQRDVDEGRDKLNWSEWGPEAEGDESAETVLEGSMPPRTYTLLHAEARLSDEEIDALVAGLEATFGSGESGGESGDGD